MRIPYHYSKIAVYSALIAMHGGAAQAGQIDRPAMIKFGASVDTISALLAESCDSAMLRDIEPVEIPDVARQQQIDCDGLSYFGAPREAEFVFGDDALLFVWILTRAEEDAALVAAFTEKFGAPSHATSMFTAFADHNAAVRKDKPEVLFYSDAVAPQYRAWFDQQAAGE